MTTPAMSVPKSVNLVPANFKTCSSSKLIQDYLFDIFHMPSHGCLRGFRIATLDRSQDSAVGGQRLLRTPLHLQCSFARVAKQVHHHVEHFEDDAVARG